MKLSYKNKDGVIWYEGNKINYNGQKKLRLLFTTRVGGFSSDHYDSLNFSYNVGDDSAVVKKNYNLFLNKADLKKSKTINGHQTHGTNIVNVNKKNYSGKEPITDCDGLMTMDTGLSLLAYFADCVPIYLWDDELNVIAIVHAGRKGTVNNIAGKMIQTIINESNITVDKLNALIGPCICGNCYEVGTKEFQEFVEQGYIEANNKNKIDLRNANKMLLVKSGININNVYDLDICTCCNPEQFYSYRYNYSNGGKSGRMMAVINITELGGERHYYSN